jgi:hypothetical protein
MAPHQMLEVKASSNPLCQTLSVDLSFFIYPAAWTLRWFHHCVIMGKVLRIQWWCPSYFYFWSILVICKWLFGVSWPSRFISEIEAICRQWLADGPKILIVLLFLGSGIHASVIIIALSINNAHSCRKKVRRAFILLKIYTRSNVNWSMGKESILWSIISWNLQKVRVYLRKHAFHKFLYHVTSFPNNRFLNFFVSHSPQYSSVGQNSHWDDDTHSMQLSFGVNDFLVRSVHVAFL